MHRCAPTDSGLSLETLCATLVANIADYVCLSSLAESHLVKIPIIPYDGGLKGMTIIRALGKAAVAMRRID